MSLDRSRRVYEGVDRTTPVFETLVVATDGSAGVSRAVAVAVDLASRFDAAAHAVYVVDENELEAAPDAVRDEMRTALEDRGERAIGEVADAADGAEIGVETAVREGRPAAEITTYARDVDADAVALGVRGRHGEARFLLGSVAERVVQRCPVPVLTVRRESDSASETAD